MGAAGNLAFYKGFPHTTHISSLVASAIVTTKEQLLVNANLCLDVGRGRQGSTAVYFAVQEAFSASRLELFAAGQGS